MANRKAYDAGSSCLFVLLSLAVLLWGAPLRLRIIKASDKSRVNAEKVVAFLEQMEL